MNNHNKLNLKQQDMMTNNDKQASFPDGKSLAGESPEVLRTKDYEPPVTRRTSVEVEGGVCKDSMVSDEESREDPTISISAQEVGTISDYSTVNEEAGITGDWDY